MKFYYQILATVALMTSGAVSALDNGVVLSKTFGGPHGKEYSDLDISKPGQDVKSITVQAGERVNGLGLVVRDANGVESEVFHCGRGGSPKTLTLGDGEFITGMEAHYGEKDDHTRIKYIKFFTNRNNTIEGGDPDKKMKGVGTDAAPKGYQLGGFFGRCGKELDSVGAIWTSIEPVAA